MSSQTNSAINLLIADATAMVCELLKEAFRRRPKFIVRACATSLQELEHIARQEAVHVPLIGVNLTDGPFTGLKAIQKIRVIQPRCRPVLLFEGTDDNLVVEAFRAGAKGVFLRSEQGFDALCKCIVSVHAGEIWASNKQLEVVIEALARSAPLRIVTQRGENVLSKREDEIVHLVAEGASNREIATRLGLSQHTVKNYLFKIFDKLGVSSRVELVLYAMHDRKSVDVPRKQPLAS